MVGIVLTLLAVFLVICLAFCYSDHTHPRSDPSRDLPFLERIHKRKS